MSTQKKDLTERKLLLKLELMGAPAQKLVSVARTVYDIEPDYTMVPAKNNLEWHTTDEVLYREAKETYDAITMPFRADPQVYKFESTKEKIWEWNKNNGKQEQKLTKSIVYQSDHDAKRRGKVLKKEKHKDKLEKTFLDPFVLSKKWIKQTIEDKTFYFNIETNERLDHEPPGVWYDKLHLLEKLTPREELDGYEYRESEEERSHRLQYQVRFQKSLKDEIRRREQHPTEIEQVEDVLYDIVNAIHMEAERAAYEEKLEEKRKIWDTWNMATKGYRMKPLGTRETEAGEVYNIVSDFEFNNFIISNTGHMIARTIPKAVLDIHANEREMLAEAKRQHLEMIETERRKPFVQKLRMAMVMMKTDRKAALNKVASDLAYSATYVPRAIHQTGAHKIMYQRSKRLLEQGMKAMKDLVEDPQDTLEVVATTMRKMYKSVLNPKNDFEELSINLQEIEGIVDDRERERKQQEKLRAIQEWEEAERIRKESLMSNKEISVSQADAVMVTFTFLYDPPPLYSRHPPRTWKDEVKDLTAKSLNGLESLKQLNKSLTIPLPLIKKRIRKDDTSSNVNANTDPVKISSFVTKCNEQSTMKDSLHESSSLSLVTAEDDNLEELEEESDSSIEADDAENDLSKASPKEKKVARTPKTSSQADNVVSPTKGSIKKRPLVHPKIIPKAILVGKPNTGLLAIEDLIIKPTDQPDYCGPLVYDLQDRKQFEATLLQQISFAAYIPEDQISIEEIRRLPVNSSNLEELAKKNKFMLNTARLKNENAKMTFEFNKQYRKLLAEGKIAEADSLCLPSYHVIKEYEDRGVEGREGTNGAQQKIPVERSQSLSENIIDDGLVTQMVSSTLSESVAIIEKAASSTTLMDLNDGRLDSSEDYMTLPPKSDLKNTNDGYNSKSSAINSELVIDFAAKMSNIDERISKTNRSANAQQILDVIQPSVSIVENLTENIATSDHDGTSSSITGRENSVMGSPVEIKISSPINPTQYKVGIMNPDDLKHDPNYWLSKDLNELSAEEKRQIRLSRLKLLRKESELRAKIKDLQDLREQIIEDTLEYIAPLLEQTKPIVQAVQPFVAIVKPVILHTRDAMVAKAIKCVESIGNNYNGKKLLELNRIKSILAVNHGYAGNQRGSADGVGNAITNGSSGSENSSIVSIVIVSDDRDIVHALLQEIVVAVEENYLMLREDKENLIIDEINTSNSAISITSAKSMVSTVKRSDRRDEKKGPLSNSTGRFQNDRYEGDSEDFLGVIMKLQRDLQEGNAKDSNTGDEEDNISMTESEKAMMENNGQEGSIIEVQLSVSEQQTNADNYNTNEIISSQWANPLIVERRDSENPEYNVIDGVDRKRESVVDAATGMPPLRLSQRKKISEDVRANEYERGNVDINEVERRLMEAEDSDLEGKLLHETGKEFLADRNSEALEELEEDVSESSDEKQIHTTPQDSSTIGKELVLLSNDKSTRPVINRLDSVIEESAQSLADEVASIPIKEEASLEIAVIEKDEINTLHQLAELQKEQFELDQKESQLNDLEVHKSFRLLNYDPEIVEILDQMCMAVARAMAETERHNSDNSSSSTEGSDDISEREAFVSATTHTAKQPVELFEESELDAIIAGCEVTVLIRVSDKQRSIEGLEDIEAEDIAILLQQQLYEPSTPLYAGSITSTVLDIKYRLPFQQRQFQSWETFWAHVVHPSFFGYSTLKSKTKHGADDGIRRLPSGVVVSNPIDKFTDLQKKLLMSLNEKSKRIEEKNRNKRPRSSENRIQEFDASPRSTADHYSVDLNVDEFSKGGNGLTVWRPNMEKLTEKDLIRLERLMKAFEDQYNKQMARGLVDGKRLRPEQYIALKDRNTAKRIYISARQRFGRMNKHLMVEEFPKPELKVTPIQDDVFQFWVKEVKQEDHKRLLQKRAEKEKLKEILKQEIESRKIFMKQKYWLIQAFIDRCENVQETSMRFQNELQHLDRVKEKVKVKDFSTEDEAIAMTERVSSIKKLIISEERRTRTLFDTISQWSKRRNESNTFATVSARITADGLEGRQRRNSRRPNSRGATEIVEVKPETSKPNTPADIVNKPGKHTDGSMSDAVSLLEKEDVMKFLQTCINAAKEEELKAKFAEKSAALLQAQMAQIQRIHNLQYTKAAATKLSAKYEAVHDSTDYTATRDVEIEEEVNKLREEVEFLDGFLNQLTDKELLAVKELKWVSALSLHSNKFLECLKNYPTVLPSCFARDELAQFATIVVDIEPLFTKVLEDMSKAKEAADAALGINNKKRRETKHKSVEPSNDIATGVDQTVNDTETVVTGESEDPALLEAKLVAIRKKAEREKAWFMAHTHQYIQFPEETAFCIVCKQREVEYYCKLHKDAEKNMAKDFPKILDQYTEEMEADIRGDIEYQFSQQYQSQAVALVEEELQKEAEAAATEQSALPQIINKLGSLFGDRSDVQADESIQEQRMRLESQDAAEEDLAWESHLNNAKRILDKAGLCHVDNKGKSILPERPQTTAKKRFIPPHVVEALTNGEDASIGLKIRVWHRDLNGLRSYFLGAIAFTEQECLDPPNGIRSYKLQDDSAIVGSDPITVTGVITLKFNVTKVSKRPKKRRWRLEIIRASKLAAVDESDLSNPYCEVYWKGLVEINGRMEGKGDWISVGCTVRKNKTLGPKYDKDDGAVFDLPPIYTEKELFNRGINETDVVKTGGFIARNFCNDNEDEKAATKKKDNKFEFGSKSVEENKKYRIGVKLNELYTLETVERLTILREQRKAEERERKSMGVEELLHRQYLIQVETMRCKPLMEIQQAYAKSFMRLLQLVQEAPNMLARLRFMMAMPLEGGGMKVLCQDPTNLMMYDTVIVPLLYKEDERNLVEQLNCLIGKFAPNLTKITDFSVHQVRDFNFKGFVTTSERVGITILEHYEGPTVLEYIEERWEKFNNEQMREVLNQIISAIVSLHEEGIIHRNIHPKSIVVQLPDLKKNRFGAVSEVSVSPVKKQKVIAAKPVCRLGEYLLLHNPRKPNCNYSQGRADWGDKSTRPPDQTITAKSDVYGFGICVYHWATKGSMPPNTFYHTKSVDVLMKDIPTKWGKWMSLLLNMCLQANPSMRASSKEIQLFLSAKVGK